VANIIPLKRLEELYRVTYDSSRGVRFVIWTEEGNITLKNNGKGMP
jgi:hypothetical protein